MEQHGEVDDLTVVQVLRAYARQARLIDSFDGPGWAATFTTDGVFASPSYPQPVVGTDALVAFVEQYAETARATRTTSRHVVTNVDVVPGPRPGSVVAHAYLQIVATPAGEPSRLVRLTTLTDQLVASADGWRFARRDVRRDDVPPVPDSTPDSTPESTSGARP
ncbi:nuclear transport factor 2 family protein [Nocardioides hwasunensis]|uniref:Nuclear transport factor 2 family protein n=1 Tax=Nocardioides hwasunensis TaxID=397258 RepID=A0ABR8MNV3_9ACTN|nr:nuclear transport factor 2 family protein [Nocardioides hwasunensis]MBD3916716.1 nuclear transport factor 2 family protein [Nocardioides hwasunensis]